MLIKTRNKMEAVRAFINTWLKDETFYCNNCGEKWDAGYHMVYSCCQNPQFGRNIDHTMGVIKQNRMLKQTRKNEFASTDDKSLRFGISLPRGLYVSLENYFSKEYKEKLFENNKELHDFMREFPDFCIPKNV